MKASTELEAKTEELSEDGNIDKIRDILFGVQVRDFEEKFAKLEARFGKEVESLRDETREKLDKLEEYVNKEVTSLTDKIYEEQDLRGDALKKLTSESQGLARDLEMQISKLGEKTSKNESDIRSQLLDQSKALADTIQMKQDEMMSSLEKKAAELNDNKADRTALADLFTEMAMRLTGEFKIPESNEKK